MAERVYYDMTAAQNILLFSQKYCFKKQINNIATSFFLEKEMNFDTLKKAVVMAVKRNTAMQVQLTTVDKVQKQYFATEVEPEVGFWDFSKKGEKAQEKAFKKVAEKRVTLDDKPLYRIFMVRTWQGWCGIFSCISHMIMDSWSICMFYQDVMHLYEALENGTEMPKPLPDSKELLLKDLDYPNTKQYQKDLEFWTEEFKKPAPIFSHPAGWEYLDLFRKKKKNPALNYAQIFVFNCNGSHLTRVMPKRIVDKMAAYAQEHNVSMQSFFMLGISAYLAYTNKHDEIEMCTANARRGTLLEKYSGGSRVLAHPLHLQQDRKRTFREAVNYTYARQTGIFKHLNFSYNEVTEMHDKVYNKPQIYSFYTASLTFQPMPMKSADGCKIHTMWHANGAVSLPFYVTVMDDDGTGNLRVYYECQDAHVSAEQADFAHDCIMKLLEAGLDNDELTLEEIFATLPELKTGKVKLPFMIGG